MEFTADTLYYRYDCAPDVAPSFHRLAVKTFGTLSNAQRGVLSNAARRASSFAAAASLV